MDVVRRHHVSNDLSEVRDLSTRHLGEKSVPVRGKSQCNGPVAGVFEER